MANLKQEEELNDACSMSLALFDIPKYEELNKDIKVEHQDFSEMRSEFDLPSLMNCSNQSHQSIDLPSSIAPHDRLVNGDGDEDHENPVPKHELKDIKLEPQDYSNTMRSEFELFMPSTPTTNESKTRHNGKAERVFSCSRCDKAFTTAQLLQEHASRAHEEGCKFPCSLCDHVAKSNANLKRHERMVHRGEGKEHVCPECNKRFTTNSNLQNHIRVHTGEKPFVCSVCARGFSQKSYLKRHQDIHTGEKPFACKWCDKKFGDSTQRSRHQRRIHTGEKPYICRWCDTRFADLSDLTSHQRKCQICSYRFRQSQDLRRRAHKSC